MGTYGLSLGHLREALADFAIHLLASGDDLAYGGDLRAHGFTELLFDLVARYRRPAEVRVRPPVTNYLAWPVHISMTAETLSGFEAHILGSAQLALIGRDGSRLTMEQRHSLQRHEPDESEWAEGLTRMRRIMRAETDARVVLGGRVEDYKGRMPGIAEEALLSLQSGQAVFLVGGFGGCTRDIAETLELVEPREDPTQDGGDGRHSRSGESETCTMDYRTRRTACWHARPMFKRRSIWCFAASAVYGKTVRTESTLRFSRNWKKEVRIR